MDSWSVILQEWYQGDQPALPLVFDDDATFEHFWPEQNQACVAWLQRYACGLTGSVGDTGDYAYVYGEPGSGRTHLLWAVCHAARAYGRQCVYIPLQEGAGVALLAGVEALSLVCVDDVEGIVGDPAQEEALFHAYNRCMARGTQMLVSMRFPPHQLALGLADLRSRLSQGMGFKVAALSEAGQIQALQLRARNRGLQLTVRVCRFLLRRFQRDMGTLYRLLVDLDQAALAAKRPITIPFIKQVFGV